MKRILFTIAALLVSASAFAQTPYLRARYAAGQTVAQLSWSPVTNANRYGVRHATAYPSWGAEVNVGTLTSYNYPVSVNGGYVFQVRAYDAANQVIATSNVALVTTYAFSADPLVDIKAQFLSELRTMTNAARAAAGVSAMSWTHAVPAAATPLYKEHWSDVRTGVDGALQSLGYSSLSAYTDPVLSSSIAFRKIHIEEMRARLRSYPEWMTAFMSVSPVYFSPNGDPVKETTTLTASISATSVIRWQLNVRNPSNQVVRSVSGTGPSVVYTWDGRNASNVVQPDGTYTFEIVDLEANAPIATALTILDNTAPLAALTVPGYTHPSTGQTCLSNVKQSGATSVSLTGRATDGNFETWTLTFGAAQIGAGTSPVQPNTQITAWNTGAVSNADGTLRLTVNDLAGNESETTVNVRVDNFSASKNRDQMNIGSGETTSFSWTSPACFATTAQLQIENLAGALQKSVDLAPVTSPYAWNGSTNAGGIVTNGAYQYKIVVTVTDTPSQTITWNDNTLVGGGKTQLPYPFCRNASGSYVRCSANDTFDFDPYANKPLWIKFCIGSGSSESYSCTPATLPALAIVKTPTTPETNESCGAGECVFYEYRPGGDVEFAWYGWDWNGSTYIAGKPYMAAIRDTDNVRQNMVVAYNSGPSITAVTGTPLVFNPTAGTQSWTVTTTNPVSTVILELRNASNGAILRRIEQASSTSPHVVTWDGKSDPFGSDGPMYVAPGLYQVIVTVRDAQGREARITPMTTVQY